MNVLVPKNEEQAEELQDASKQQASTRPVTDITSSSSSAAEADVEVEAEDEEEAGLATMKAEIAEAASSTMSEEQREALLLQLFALHNNLELANQQLSDTDSDSDTENEQE